MSKEHQHPDYHRSTDPQPQGQTTVSEGTGPGHPQKEQ